MEETRQATEIHGQEDEKPLDDKIARAADIAEFWRICCFYAYKSLSRIARGGPDKVGGKMMSARHAMRLARKTIEDFEEAVEQEKLALLKAEEPA